MLPNTDELRRLAEQATDGPWWIEPEQHHYNGIQDAYIAFGTLGDGSDTYDLLDVYNVDTDYRYIAAMHPQTTLALLDKIEQLTKERDELRAQVAVLHQAIGVTIKRWYDTKDCTLRIDELYRAVDLVSTDRSAQYVRGLEAALSNLLEAIAGEQRDPIELERALGKQAVAAIDQADHALAAKGDRG